MNIHSEAAKSDETASDFGRKVRIDDERRMLGTICDARTRSLGAFGQDIAFGLINLPTYQESAYLLCGTTPPSLF